MPTLLRIGLRLLVQNLVEPKEHTMCEYNRGKTNRAHLQHKCAQLKREVLATLWKNCSKCWHLVIVVAVVAFVVVAVGVAECGQTHTRTDNVHIHRNRSVYLQKSKQLNDFFWKKLNDFNWCNLLGLENVAMMKKLRRLDKSKRNVGRINRVVTME